MIARRVYMQLKPNSVAALTEKMEKDVLPLLRGRPGFQDEIILIGNGGNDALGISLWDGRENAEAYNRETYPEVVKLLAGQVEGTPKVRTFEVAASTLHRIATAETT
jgi:hypothetical protein